MAKRYVTCVKRDSDGDTTHLGNNGAPWSPRAKKDAIHDIENGVHQYYARDAKGNEAEIHVVNDPDGKYLRTNPDGKGKNNLDSLPEC